MCSRIKKIFIVFVLIIICFILQNTISVLSGNLFVTPNILIILTCIFGYMRGEKEAILIGFVSGMLVDIFACDIIGLNALLYMFVGFFSGIFHRLFYRDMIVFPLVIVIAGDFLYNMGFYIARFVLRNRLDFTFYFLKIIFPEIVITTFSALILFRLFYAINFKLLTEEQRSKLRFD